MDLEQIRQELRGLEQQVHAVRMMALQTRAALTNVVNTNGATPNITTGTTPTNVIVAGAVMTPRGSGKYLLVATGTLTMSVADIATVRVGQTPQSGGAISFTGGVASGVGVTISNGTAGLSVNNGGSLISNAQYVYQTVTGQTTVPISVSAVVSGANGLAVAVPVAITLDVSLGGNHTATVSSLDFAIFELPA